MRQFVDGGKRLTVGGGHGGGVGAFSLVADLDVLVPVQVEEAHDVAVFAHLVVRLFNLLAQVGGLVAVPGGRRFGKAAVGRDDLDGYVVDVVRAAVDGGHAHHPPFIHLEAEEGTVQVLLNHLRGMQVVADLLVFGILLEGVPALDGIQFRLFGLEHAVQVGKALLLLLQLHFLHQLDAGTACLEGFRIKNLDAVYPDFRLAVVALLEGFTGRLQLFAGFLLDVLAGEERAAEARQ